MSLIQEIKEKFKKIENIEETTFEEIIQIINFKGKKKTLRTYLADLNIPYKRVHVRNETTLKLIDFKDSELYTAEELKEIIGYEGTMNAFRAYLNTYNISFKKAETTRLKSNEIIKLLEIKETEQLTANELKDKVGYKGTLNTFRVLLNFHNIPYKKVFNDCKVIEKIRSIQGTENYTAEELKELVQYDGKLKSFRAYLSIYKIPIKRKRN